MALSSLSLNASAAVNWTATKNVTGANPNSNSSSANEARAALGTGAAGNAANGLNEEYFSITSIAGSGSATIDLSSFTDILGATGIVGVRTKFIQVELLSTTQDSTNGTAASSITIDATVANGLTSQSGTGWLTNATSKFDIPNGGWIQFGCTNANGIAIDSTHKILKVTNNDAGVAAAVKIIVGISTV